MWTSQRQWASPHSAARGNIPPRRSPRGLRREHSPPNKPPKPSSQPPKAIPKPKHSRPRHRRSRTLPSLQNLPPTHHSNTAERAGIRAGRGIGGQITTTRPPTRTPGRSSRGRRGWSLWAPGFRGDTRGAARRRRRKCRRAGALWRPRPRAVSETDAGGSRFIAQTFGRLGSTKSRRNTVV